MTRMKLAIEKSGLKQLHIAQKIGIDSTMLSHYVRGERPAPPEVLRAIAKLLKIRQVEIEGVLE